MMYMGRVTIFLIICIIFMLYVPHVSAAPINVMVCGEGKGSSAEQEALENARYRAVKKALLQLTAADDRPASLYQLLLAQYRKFSGPLEITQRSQSGEDTYLLGRVTVDVDQLSACMKQLIITEKNRDIDGRTVYFFVRVNGLKDKVSEQAAEQLILWRYGDTFQKIGFTTEDEDTIFKKMAEYNDQSYAEFSTGIKQRLNDVTEVTLAVIGEINVGFKEQDKDGSIADSDIHIEIIDYASGQKKIGELKDSYEIRQDSAEKAQKFILEKSAINSAKTLADQTNLYWQKNHS